MKIKRKPTCVSYNPVYESNYEEHNDRRNKDEDDCQSREDDEDKKKCDDDRGGGKGDDGKKKRDDDSGGEKDNCELLGGKGKKNQAHVHEYTGSTRPAEKCSEKHNHRFAGVTGEAIPYGKNHVHKLSGNSDFTGQHFHNVDAVTGLAIYVGKGKHIHPVYGATSKEDGHTHPFMFSTLIESSTD